MTPTDLKSARKTFGLSIEGLARALEIDERTVRRWEHGAPIPKSVRILIPLAVKSRAVRKLLGIA
jgi:DNA-binding transcriptional regulator YiaG